MKKTIIIVIVVLLLGFGIFLILPQKEETTDINKMTLEVTLLYTDNVLQTEKLPELASQDYDFAAKYIQDLMTNWKLLEEKTDELVMKAGTDKLTFRFISDTYADDREIIGKMYDAAPPGKRIQTLAKMLGVSAREAYAILKKSQEEQAVYWNNEGDRQEKLENVAKGVKNVCKVGLYVGGLAATGGATGMAAVVSEASAIISGADLVLEITEDSANAFYGYNNEYTAIFSGMRTMSKPASALIGFASLDVFSKAGAINSAVFVFDQFQSLRNDNEILGIKINKLAENSTIDRIVPEDIGQWLTSNNFKPEPAREEVLAKIEKVTEAIAPKITEKPIIEKDEKEAPKIVEEKSEAKAVEKVAPDVKEPPKVMEEKISGKKDLNKSLVGTSWKSDLSDGVVVSTIFTFAETEIQVKYTMTNGSTIDFSLPYTYEDGTGYYGRDDDLRAIQKVVFKIEDGNLVLNTVAGDIVKFYPID